MPTAANKPVKIHEFTADGLTQPGEHILCAVIIGPDRDDPTRHTLHLRSVAAERKEVFRVRTKGSVFGGCMTRQTLLKVLEPEASAVCESLNKLLGIARAASFEAADLRTAAEDYAAKSRVYESKLAAMEQFLAVAVIDS